MKKLIIPMILASLIAISCDKKATQNQAGYTGEDISKDVSIIRDKTTKAATIQIYTQGKWVLYAGRSVDGIDFSQPVAQGIDSGTFPLNITDSARSYFEIITEKGSAIVSDRHLPMTGGYNFRDLGGYKTTDGKFVKWGKIFRSDDLHKLTDSDLGYLAAIPLISIVDFRSGEEMEQAPDKNPSSVKNNYTYSISPGDLMAAVKQDISKINAEQANRMMKDMNILLVTDSACIHQYKEFFKLLQNGDDIPLMFHCSAGKDRTGMGAALVLSALGVDEQIILKDYLLSNTYLANKYAGLKSQYPAISSLFEVKPEFLQAGLDQIKKDHGSVENYLTKVLGVDIQKMREMYLY
ncbi:tyrosine-protein phosphatase [Dysgonomonas sp. GY75]|uniref:tyrosine-protein phosphatase n=1 Tax=Dysgonomonas sp. GY75 TaxID=2780419 RepID=UPI00188413B5|nr:tyrosine-protein phosphatase [Dysgonomonas sp. GY75]MBF0651240.1 tyrosine-protein phosphatase [Dysgonomonas sp. GY75]